MATPGLPIALVLGLSLLSGACHSNSVAEDAGAGLPVDAGPQWACLDQPSEVTSFEPGRDHVHGLQRLLPARDRRCHRRLRLHRGLLHLRTRSRTRRVRFARSLVCDARGSARDDRRRGGSDRHRPRRLPGLLQARGAGVPPRRGLHESTARGRVDVHPADSCHRPAGGGAHRLGAQRAFRPRRGGWRRGLRGLRLL